MNAFILLAVASTFTLPPLTSEEIARAEELREYVFSSEGGKGVDHRRIDALTEEEKELLVTYFHAQLDRRRKQSRPESSLRTSGTATDLARLDDSWGLEAVARNFRARPRKELSYTFKFVRNAKLIPMIGDLLFREEEFYSVDGSGYPPAQWTAAQSIIHTLKYASQFQPDIPQWAQQLEDAWGKPGENIMNILREWYRENEEKLRREAFLEIRPGRTPHPTLAPASVRPTAQQVVPELVASAPAAAVRLERQPKPDLIEFIDLLAIASLGVLVFLWRRGAGNRSTTPKPQLPPHEP